VQSKIRFTNNPQIFLEVAIIKMIHVTYEELSVVQRLNELQEKLNNLDGYTPQSFAQTPSMVKDEVVYEKIETLDKVLASVRSELSKLDLPSVINKVNKLSSEEKEDEISLTNVELYEELQLLKATVKSIQNQAPQTSSAPKEDVLNHAEKILNLEKQIRIIQNTNVEEICSMLEVQLRETKEEFSNARKEVARLKTIVDRPTPHGTTKVVGEINQDLVERLTKIEARIEELARGALAYYSLYLDQGSKKNRIKEVRGQMILFSDELVEAKELSKDKKPVEEIEEIEEKDETYSEELDGQEGLTEEKEETVETVNEIKEEQPKEKPAIEVKKKEEPKEEEGPKSQIVVTPPRETSFNSTLEILRLERLEKAKKEQKKSGEVKEEPKEEKTYSSNILEPRKQAKPETKPDENKKEETQKSALEILDCLPEDDFASHIEYSNKKKEEKDEIVWKSVELESESKPKDVDFDSYNIKALEYILNTALSEKAKTDAKRVKELWKDLSKNIDSNDYGVVDLLKDANIAAVGEKAILLVFESYGTSNNVMSPSFKKRATSIICKTLLGKYDYFALPKVVWEEKRKEYSIQYKNKVKDPKLEEFNDNKLVLQKEYKKIEEDEESDIVEQIYEDIFK